MAGMASPPPEPVLTFPPLASNTEFADNPYVRVPTMTDEHMAALSAQLQREDTSQLQERLGNAVRQRLASLQRLEG